MTIHGMHMKHRLRNIHTGSAKVHLGFSSFSEWLLCTYHSGAWTPISQGEEESIPLETNTLRSLPGRISTGSFG